MKPEQITMKVALAAFALSLLLSLTGAVGVLWLTYQNGQSSGYARGYDTAIQNVSNCSLEDAHAERCFIPCSSDTDCVQKNGSEDY